MSLILEKETPSNKSLFNIAPKQSIKMYHSTDSEHKHYGNIHCRADIAKKMWVFSLFFCSLSIDLLYFSLQQTKMFVIAVRHHEYVDPFVCGLSCCLLSSSLLIILKSRMEVFVENNAPLPKSLPFSHSDFVLMQQSVAAPFRHIHTNYYFRELRQRFCYRHTLNRIEITNQAMNIY